MKLLPKISFAWQHNILRFFCFSTMSNMNTEGTIESVPVKQTDLRENARAFTRDKESWLPFSH